MKLEDHPTVQRIRLKTIPSVPPKKESLDGGWLKQLVLDAGADDVGFVEIGRHALDDQRESLVKAFPHAKTLISFVVRMNRGTILLDAEVSESNQPIDYNPCLECKLCVAACPVEAISPEGGFNFSACYTHNYREFMGGFTDWVEQVVDSKNGRDYRSRVSDAESASMWQSLSFGANYKAAYCLAVCPAGEDVIEPFLTNRKAHLKDVVRPLQEKEETIYVAKNSDAEDHVAKRFPHKKIKHVGNTLRPNTIELFLNGWPQG